MGQCRGALWLDSMILSISSEQNGSMILQFHDKKLFLTAQHGYLQKSAVSG